MMDMQWIKCSERLPMIGQRAFIYPIDDGIEVAEYMGDRSFAFWGFIATMRDVTHWMPMPELPSGEEAVSP